MSKLDNTQKQLLEHFCSMWVPNGPNGKAYIKKDMLSIPLDVENVGNGTAVNFRVGLNKKTTESLYMLPQALKQGRSMYIHIFSSTAYDGYPLYAGMNRKNSTTKATHQSRDTNHRIERMLLGTLHI